MQTRTITPGPVVLVGERLAPSAQPGFLIEEGGIDAEDRELFWFAETAQDIWDGIVRWYENAGELLFTSPTG